MSSYSSQDSYLSVSSNSLLQPGSCIPLFHIGESTTQSPDFDIGSHSCLHQYFSRIYVQRVMYSKAMYQMSLFIYAIASIYFTLSMNPAYIP